MCYIGLRISRILKNAWWFWGRLFCNFPISKLAIIMLWMLNSSRWESHKQHTTLSLRIFYIPTYIALQVLATYTLFFISNIFISNVRLNLAKNKAKAKQHPEAELWCLKIIRFLHSRYQPKIIGDILKNVQKCTKKSASVLIHSFLIHPFSTSWKP